jgi:PAS domain S-box-containing protein
MDKSTNVIEVNPEIEAMSGYKREQVLGKTFYELFSTKQIRLEHLALFKRILAGEKIQGYELKMRRANGDVNDYLISASIEVNADGNPVIIAIAQDMGAQKMLESSLIAAREAAESADRIKSMFVASMSHELRTPLNSIIGFIGVVLQGMSGAINDKQKEQLGRAYGSAKHLLSLISDVIDISKIEAGYLQVHIERFELKPLLIEVEQVVRHIALEKSLDVSIECAKKITLETDRKRLYQVILNVLSNAVKYTEKGSVKVIAKVVEDELIISTQDTGIGMSEVALTKLFKPFERAESHLRIKTLGTGLGLYLTKKVLTQLLGGTIEVVSKPEVGSVFTMKVPLKAPEISTQADSVL